MAELKFWFPKDDYILVLNGELSVEEFLNDVLMGVGMPEEDGHEQLAGALLQLHWGDGGSPEVSDFNVTDSAYDSIKKLGSFTIEYTVYLYFGCDDINKEVDCEEKFNFSIDDENDVLKIITPERHVRDTIDEF